MYIVHREFMDRTFSFIQLALCCILHLEIQQEICIANISYSLKHIKIILTITAVLAITF